MDRSDIVVGEGGRGSGAIAELRWIVIIFEIPRTILCRVSTLAELYIRIVKHPNRFEFIIQNGVDRASVRELATKIYLHMRSLSKDVDISLLSRGKKVKHTTLLSKDRLHKMTYENILSFLNKILPKRMSKPKHIVLHQYNARGGLLYSEAVHHPMYRKYFTL